MLTTLPKNTFNHLFFSLVIYFLSVDFAYKKFMLGMWGNDFLERGLAQVEDNYFSWLITFLIYLVVAFILSITRKRPSDFLFLIFFAIPITPMFVLSANKGIGISYILATIICFFVSYQISNIKIRLHSYHSKRGLFTPQNYLKFCIWLGIFTIIWIIINNGLEFVNFNFADVYLVRRDASDSRGRLLNYILFNYVGILLGIGFAIAFSKRSIRSIIMLLIINIALFGFTSNKSYLFVGVFTFGIYFILGTRRPKVNFILLLSAISIILTTLYLIDSKQGLWGTLFIRRYIFVPAYANFLYWDFFSSNPFAFWSDSKVGLSIIDSPYGIPTPQVIANHYSGVDFSDSVQQFNNTNTGWLGSGYGNAGFIGMLVYAVISGLVIKYINVLRDLVGSRVAISGVSFYFFAVFFTSSDLPAALLSYGFIALVIIMFLWRRPKTLNGS